MGRHALIALGALGAFACTPQPTLPEETVEPIRIGIVTSLSGSLGSDGPGWRDAARLAVLEANAAGGPLPGRRIEALVRDDGTNPAGAQGIADELVNTEGVVGIIGAAASSISLGIIDVATPARIPQLSCCSTSDNITAENMALQPEDRFFFRTIAPDILQSQVVSIAANDLTCGRVAILHIDDDYGTPFGEAIRATYTAGGGTVSAVVPFTDGQPDYSAEVGMIRTALGDCSATTCCIALVAYPESAATIVRNWNSGGGGAVTWIGTDGIRAPGFVDEAVDPGLIDGFFGTSPITDPQTPAYADFVDRYRAVFGTDPIPYSSNQYDAVALLVLAIARAGTTDGDAVRDALREVASAPPAIGFVSAASVIEGLDQIRMGNDINYEGASGNVNFDEVHNVVSPFEIWRYDEPGAGRTCPGPVQTLSENRGSFCRLRTINAEEIGS